MPMRHHRRLPCAFVVANRYHLLFVFNLHNKAKTTRRMKIKTKASHMLLGFLFVQLLNRYYQIQTQK